MSKNQSRQTQQAHQPGQAQKAQKTHMSRNARSKKRVNKSAKRAVKKARQIQKAQLLAAQRLEAQQTDQVTRFHMSKERLIALTDAIIAIIMTILVLELPKPASATWQAFWNLRQSFTAYAISFFWLAELWGILNRVWEHVRRINSATIVWTFILLFFTSFMPYATNLDSANFMSPVMQMFYGLDVLAVSVIGLVLHTVVARVNLDNPVLLTFLHALKVEMIPIFVIQMIGIILTLTVWAPAVTVSIIVGWIGMDVVRHVSKKQTIVYLKAMRKECACQEKQSSDDLASADLSPEDLSKVDLFTDDLPADLHVDDLSQADVSSTDQPEIDQIDAMGEIDEIARHTARQLVSQ